MRLILASASARRQQLLARVGIEPARIEPPEIDETMWSGEKPHHYVVRMAREKVLAGTTEPDEVRLAADTIVVCGQRILGKPVDVTEAEDFLRHLAGRRHRVLTAIAVRAHATVRVRRVASQVKFRRLTSDDIAGYLRASEWQGKAGGYAIQGRAAEFIPWINGSYSAIVGLPLAETVALLRSVGWR